MFLCLILLSTVIAYCFFAVKPQINFNFEIDLTSHSLSS